MVIAIDKNLHLMIKDIQVEMILGGVKIIGLREFAPTMVLKEDLTLTGQVMAGIIKEGLKELTGHPGGRKPKINEIPDTDKEKGAMIPDRSIRDMEWALRKDM